MLSWKSLRPITETTDYVYYLAVPVSTSGTFCPFVYLYHYVPYYVPV